MSFRETAGLPGVGLTSYLALVTHGNLKAGERVLILGGSSGTGVVGIQIAKALGLSFVVATTSSRNTEFVKTLGADQVIDYTSEKWWEVLRTHSIDLIYDCDFEALGWNDLAQQVLKPDTGVFVTLDPFAPLNESTTGAQKHQFVVSPSRHDFEILTEVVDAVTLSVPIDSVHKFENLHDTITKQKSNRARSKVILEIIPKV